MDEEYSRSIAGGTTLRRRPDRFASAPPRTWDDDLESVRTIHIRLRPAQYRELVRKSREDGLRPWDLVLHWVEERLENVGPERDVAAELNDLSELLDEYRESVEKGAARIERLERAYSQILAALRPETRDGVHGASHPEPSHAGTPSLPRETIRVKLHDEILAILGEAGRPLSASEIAARVNARGVYRTRDGGVVDTSVISGRVAHPQYRDLFRREGRLIRAATADSGGDGRTLDSKSSAMQ